MPDTDSAERGTSNTIQNALAWEDADVLVAALRPGPGDTVVSVASAGDTALALLAEGPERVIAVDRNPAQLACLRMRVAMYKVHTHQDVLELMGSRPSGRRRHLLDQAAQTLSMEDQAFWASRIDQVRRYGLGGVGAFENRLRVFREWVLPFIHNHDTIDSLMRPRAPADRQAFFDRHWNNVGWRMMLRLLFAPAVTRWLGHGRMFFDRVEAAASEHVARVARKVLVDQDPTANPCLFWILNGTHGDCLPRALELERFETIRDRLDRLEIRLGSVETLGEEGVSADAFSLSDAFTGMSPEAHEKAYAGILAASKPGARVAYWTTASSRRAPPSMAARIRTNAVLEARLAPLDKAVFYSGLVIEEVG